MTPTASQPTCLLLYTPHSYMTHRRYVRIPITCVLLLLYTPQLHDSPTKSPSPLCCCCCTPLSYMTHRQNPHHLCVAVAVHLSVSSASSPVQPQSTGCPSAADSARLWPQVHAADTLQSPNNVTCLTLSARAYCLSCFVLNLKTKNDHQNKAGREGGGGEQTQEINSKR